MRLLFVVQRYGPEVAGGAELYCRQMATHLAARGHDVDALTSCAVSYVDWHDSYPPGDTVLDGVTVHRLPVAAPRADRFFGPLNARAVWGRKPAPLYLQQEWMRRQGPYLPGLVPWLWEHGPGYDAVVFVTYLYYTTWGGLPAVAGRVPTVLHPTAHYEPPLALPLFDSTFRLPTAYGFLVEEEAALVRRRFRTSRPTAIVGVGTDLGDPADPAPFRQASGLGERPYLLYVGRVDPDKGSVELYDFFCAYKRRRPGPLALAIVGEPVSPLPPHRDVVTAGFVPEALKRSAMAGATALVQPSYYESFSMVLTETWAQGRPALVQGRCDVLEGQARRSGGGIPYRGFAEFEAAVDLVAGDEGLQRRLGEAGRRYVERRYRWDLVLDRYERLLEYLA